MSSLNSCRPFKLVNCTWQMCEAWLIICETICALSFSGDWEGGAEGSDAQGWRQQWICVWGESSIKHRKTHAFHSFFKLSVFLFSWFYPLLPPGFICHHLLILPPFHSPLQASWSDGFVSSVVRTRQEVTELLSQVWTTTETHFLWLIIIISGYTARV